jgi:hypothetical protein
MVKSFTKPERDNAALRSPGALHKAAKAENRVMLSRAAPLRVSYCEELTHPLSLIRAARETGTSPTS